MTLLGSLSDFTELAYTITINVKLGRKLDSKHFKNARYGKLHLTSGAYKSKTFKVWKMSNIE